MTGADPAPETDGPAREHPGCVIGISLGLLASLAFVVQLAVFRAHTIEPSELLGELFVEAAPPYGLRPRDAAALPDGTRTVVVEADELARADWKKASEHVSPVELSLLLYPGAKPVRDQFQAREGGGGDHGKLDRWREDPSKTFEQFLDAGELYWGEWRAVWYRERCYEDDGLWRDRISLNLSKPDRWLVLRALWPPEIDAEEEALAELLRAWPLR